MVELIDAFERAREDQSVGVVILTGEGPRRVLLGRRPAGQRQPRRRVCTGADPSTPASTAVGRFHVTDLHVQIRRLPKPVVAMVAGYAIGGGHVLHVICDLTIAADNARFGQTGPEGRARSTAASERRCSRASRPEEGQGDLVPVPPIRRARGAQMGLVNAVVPLEQLEAETVKWCSEMLALSPFALRLLKASFNADEDGLAGLQQLAHDANLLFYMSEEAPRGEAPTSRNESRTSRSFPATAVTATTHAPSGVRIWLMAARRADAPGGGRTRARRDVAGGL